MHVDDARGKWTSPPGRCSPTLSWISCPPPGSCPILSAWKLSHHQRPTHPCFQGGDGSAPVPSQPRLSGYPRTVSRHQRRRSGTLRRRSGDGPQNDDQYVQWGAGGNVSKAQGAKQGATSVSVCAPTSARDSISRRTSWPSNSSLPPSGSPGIRSAVWRSRWTGGPENCQSPTGGRYEARFATPGRTAGGDGEGGAPLQSFGELQCFVAGNWGEGTCTPSSRARPHH